MGAPRAGVDPPRGPAGQKRQGVCAVEGPILLSRFVEHHVGGKIRPPALAVNRLVNRITQTWAKLQLKQAVERNCQYGVFGFKGLVFEIGGVHCANFNAFGAIDHIGYLGIQGNIFLYQNCGLLFLLELVQ